MQLPAHIPYLVVGAGVHGLSTAYHLAQELKVQGKGSGADILVVDKKDIAAGASGIACGVTALTRGLRRLGSDDTARPTRSGLDSPMTGR